MHCDFARVAVMRISTPEEAWHAGTNLATSLNRDVIVAVEAGQWDLGLLGNCIAQQIHLPHWHPAPSPISITIIDFYASVDDTYWLWAPAPPTAAAVAAAKTGFVFSRRSG
ncbi:hypothetical protein TSMEX_011537 [Taenia solium]|eukprot:TsM_001037900 transcript=TsM_001037900 gene=TsM_001037900